MRRLSFLLLALPLALLAASCGGGSSSGSGSVSKQDAAVVGGDHITRAVLDRWLLQAKCSYDLQKRAFPKAGSAEYQAVQSQVLQILVQRAELEQKAPSLGVSVSDKQVEAQVTQYKKQRLGGSEKRYQAELKRQCVSDADVHALFRANLVANAIGGKLTGAVKVSDGEVKAYYDTHRQVYTQPQTRVVRHILVKTKKLADSLYARLKSGADFAALAKKYSQDPGSKVQGGQLTISKGQTVPQFEAVAFALKTGELSKPVHTQFGWHIIQAMKPTTPRKSTPFAQVKEAIRQQLLQQKRSSAVQTWLDGVKKEYAAKISYATGLAPQTTTTTAAPTTTTG